MLEQFFDKDKTQDDHVANTIRQMTLSTVQVAPALETNKMICNSNSHLNNRTSSNSDSSGN